MHHHILVRMRADSQQDALDEAKSLLEDSVDKSCNEVGWDYLSDEHLVVDRAQLKKDNVKSFKAAVEDALNNTANEIIHHKAAIRDIVFKNLIQFHLSGPTAVRPYRSCKNEYGDKDEFKKPLDNASKDKKPKLPVPKNLYQLATEVVELVNPATDSMISYHIRHLERIYDCRKYPKDPQQTLQCVDNYFADLGGKGKAFYFIFDRHF